MNRVPLPVSWLGVRHYGFKPEVSGAVLDKISFFSINLVHPFAPPAVVPAVFHRALRPDNLGDQTPLLVKPRRGASCRSGERLLVCLVVSLFVAGLVVI